MLVQTMSDCHSPVSQCFALRPLIRYQIPSGDMHCSRDCNRVICAITWIKTPTVDDCSKVVVGMLEVRVDIARTTY